MSGNTSGIYQLAQRQVSTGNMPKASQVYSFPLALVLNTTLSFDLKPLANLHRINNVQGIFLDNSAGTSPLVITTDAGQNLSIPSGWQAVMPLYISPVNTMTFAGAGTINVTLLNFPTAAAVWPATGTGSVVTISGTVQTQDALAESYLATMVPTITPTSGSVAVSVVAASTQLFAANAARQYLRIGSAYNVASKVFFDIWFNDNGGVAGVGLADCFRVPAGTMYETNKKVSGKAITYFDLTGGNSISALQG